MKKIEAVIFDWAGTLVDYGCMASAITYKEIFKEYGVTLKNQDVRNGMGLDKVDHVRKILSIDHVAEQWLKNTGMEPNEGDVREINRKFEKGIINNFEKYTEPKEYVKVTIDQLRMQGIRIGSTTSYTHEMADVLMKLTKKNDILIDLVINSQDTNGLGRPYPYMIFKNMERLGISSVKNVVKVGDTVNDIKEGVNAGVYSIGITDGSSEMGLSYDEFEALSEAEKEERRNVVRERFKRAGAFYVMNNVKSLPYIINAIQNNKKIPEI